ncbi:unnamed protein product, partial [Chrysoparadoxa australica]
MGPVLVSTVGYAVACLACFGLLRGCAMTGKLSPNDEGIGRVVATVLFVCMWLFWLMAWMHQLHPLITP